MDRLGGVTPPLELFSESVGQSVSDLTYLSRGAAVGPSLPVLP